MWIPYKLCKQQCKQDQQRVNRLLSSSLAGRPMHLLIQLFLLTPGLPWYCHRILISSESSLKPCTFPSRRLFWIGMQAYSCKCFTACLDCHWPGSICNDFVWMRFGSRTLPSDLMLWLFSFFKILFYFFKLASPRRSGIRDMLNIILLTLNCFAILQSAWMPNWSP